MILASLIVSLTLQALAPSAQAAKPTDGAALVIIDMQLAFVKKYHQQKAPANAEKFQKVIEEQIEAIKAAKRAHVPIFIVEYTSPRQELGHADQRLLDAVGDYGFGEVVQKSGDGIFGTDNGHVQDFRKLLKEYKVDTLIVMGANGGSCVAESVQGALQEKIKVRAYTPGIIDFNYTQFIYPYTGYLKALASASCPKCESEGRFEEFDRLDKYFAPIVTRKSEDCPQCSGRVNAPQEGSTEELEGQISEILKKSDAIGPRRSQ